jgi:hypothetical protein
LQVFFEQTLGRLVLSPQIIHVNLKSEDDRLIVGLLNNFDLKLLREIMPFSTNYGKIFGVTKKTIIRATKTIRASKTFKGFIHLVFLHRKKGNRKKGN